MTCCRSLFAALWACKEAFVKARGDGIAFDLATLLVRPTRSPRTGTWCSASLQLGPQQLHDWTCDLQVN